MLKVGLIVDNDILLAPYAIKNIFTHFGDKYELSCVIISTKDSRKITPTQRNKEITNLFGVFGRIIFSIYYQYKCIESPNIFADICSKKNISYLFSDNVNDDKTIDYINKLEIDILLSISHQILKSEILSIPKIACINRHPGKLPEYSGMLPVLRMMLDQSESEQLSLQATMHTMVEQIDGGSILSERQYTMDNKGISLYGAYGLIYADIGSQSIEAIDNLLNNRISSQDFSNRKYFSFPDKEVCEMFRKRYNIFYLKDLYNNFGLEK